MHQAHAIGAGRGEYYIALGREDYYQEGGEAPGQWYGRGAERLGLSGQVQKDEFRNLLAGLSPDGSEVFVRKQHFVKTNEDGKPKQEACAGYDLHFSVPKSVSVLWAMGAEETRYTIQSCHDRAMKYALDVLQDEAGFSRKGKGGTEALKAEFAVALFQHGASRALDPQLHTHAVVQNIALCEDGEKRALDGRWFYRYQKAIGSIYDAKLAQLLSSELRLQIKKKGESFEVGGVPEEVCQTLSKRRAQILEMASASSHPAVREIAALESREKKGDVSHEKRLEMWQALGEEMHFARTEVEAIVRAPRIIRQNEAADREEAFRNAVEKLSAKDSHFTARHFYDALAQEGQGKVLGPMVEEARAFLAGSEEVIRLGRIGGEIRYATKAIWAAEARFIEAVEASKGDTRHVVSVDTFLNGVNGFERRKGFELKDEQIEALKELTLGSGSVKAITGMAGTGKTTMLGAAKEIWEARGLDVVGCALSGKAATGLREETGMNAESVRRTLSYIDRGKITITDRTVMVVDEAAMVDTLLAARLTDEVTRRGGMLVLVGDSAQLQAIGPGGAFKAVINRIGESHKELTTITRQNKPEDREAVMHLGKGRGTEAITSYAERGLVNVSAHSAQAIRKLITDWEAYGGAKDAKDHLIITGRRDVTAKLNEAAQEKARLAGVLGDRNITVNGRTLFEGDRVLFTYTALGLDNGTLGTIHRVDRLSQTMTVNLDSGRRVEVNLRRYDHVELGYAITTHRGQGCTVQKNAYVFVGGRMQDLHLSYVQASRAKEDTRFYTTRLEAGDKLSRLAQSMSKDREKSFAHDIAVDPKEHDRGHAR